MSDFAKHGAVVRKWYKVQVAPHTLSLSDLVPDEETRKRTAVFCADMVNGFCKEGALASARIDAISKPVAELFGRMHSAGVETFVLVQERHHPQAKEFESFPPHCVAGTDEARTICELLALPFAENFIVFYKNSLTPAFAYRCDVFAKDLILEHNFQSFLESRMPSIKTAIVVGNCTDLCVRELAMYLRLWANHHQQDMRVIIPENCVQTFDLPFDLAVQIGAMPHPGDMYHMLALYEMARNGIEVAREIV